MKQYAYFLISYFLVCSGTQGCSGRPIQKKLSPELLFEMACLPGQKIKSQTGSVWMQIRSSESNGQFPALVNAEHPSQLRLEVTNLIGGTEAIIVVQGDQYRVNIPNQKKEFEKGLGSWGGIPLHWATDLFLGKIPCPRKDLYTKQILSLTEEGALTIKSSTSGNQTASENFIYKFRKWGSLFWPEALRWERAGPSPLIVEFKFDQPEEKTGSPIRWEARSIRGEVKVRWRDRTWTQ